MDRRSRQSIVTLLQPPLLLAGALVKGAYFVLIGWWYGPYFTKKERRRFLLEVCKELSFLFEEIGATVVPNDLEPPPYFDFAVVTMDTDFIRIRVLRDRGDIRAEVAPLGSTNDWHELSLVLSKIENSGVQRRQGGFWGLKEVAELLKEHVGTLSRAFSKPAYAELGPKLAETDRDDRLRAKEFEWELNKHLYS